MSGQGTGNQNAVDWQKNQVRTDFVFIKLIPDAHELNIDTTDFGKCAFEGTRRPLGVCIHGFFAQHGVCQALLPARILPLSPV